MLTAVPDLVAPTTWVQVLGRIAVHHSGEVQRLTGSGQRLLAVLVAAGPDGATAERIAEEIWSDQQPNPWRPALRMAVARLRKQLPSGWEVVADGGFYRIASEGGWVDAWRLEETASARYTIHEDDLGWMLAGRPFGDIDLLEMVGASTQSLQMLQITVAERFCAQAPRAVSTSTCGLLTALLRDHPYNDRLAVVVARTLAGADRRTEALLALTAFADAYVSEFGAVPEDVNSFLSSGGRVDPTAPAPSIEPAEAFVEPVFVPKELRQLVESPLLGRDDSLAELKASKGALLTGPRGVGKSRLLAALIVDEPEVETTYVVGDDQLELPLGPFAVAVPSLRDDLIATTDDDAHAAHDEGPSERAASTRAWRILLAHLESASARRPQRLIVDDAHLLDPASLGLLRLLIRSNTAADVTVVACGRSDFEHADWVDLVRDAERAGLDPIQLSGLDLAAIDTMVRYAFPEATHRAHQGLALDVFEASDGLPAVAAPLIEAADPDTLALPEQIHGASALSRVASTLSEKAPEVVAAAAVLGQQFSIGALIALTELDEASIFDVLDELWSTGLIVETDDPDQVRFRHVLIQRAFLDGVPLFRRGQLHRRAAELATDPHQRADHHANASGLVPAEVTAASLRESAFLYAERRAWRQVAREVRRIDELPGDHLDASLLTLGASASDQSGADGSAYRQAAYTLAVEAGDWEAALDAALSGLPEVELPDGDQLRIDMLEGIPSASLPPGRRFDLVYNLGRQSSLIGRDSETVLEYADTALAMAADDDEVALSHVLRWFATHHRGVVHEIPPDVLHSGSRRMVMRMAQINAINLAESGDFTSARAESQRFLDLALSIGDPLRIWHAQGLQCMFLYNDAEFEAADALAAENLQLAELHDMPQGIATYVGQRVFAHDCLDRLPEMGAELEPFRATLGQLQLGRAALVLTGHAMGETDIGDEVRELVADATNRAGSTFSLLTVVFMTRFIAEYSPELATPTRALLEPFGDNPILAGFGAGSFGPTTMYVAQLASDLDERAALLDRAIEAADLQGPLLWRVRTRLERARLGSTQALEEAQALAADTELADVVRRHIEASSD